MPVAVGELAVEDKKDRSPLWRIILICLVSYIGYLLLGVWCYLVEQDHEKEFEVQKIENPDFDTRGLVLELQAATYLMIFACLRIFFLFIFIFERCTKVETVAVIWLSISTLLMMAAYFMACLNLDVFIHIHHFFITLFFVSIALDFIGNVLVIVRNNRGL